MDANLFDFEDDDKKPPPQRRFKPKPRLKTQAGTAGHSNAGKTSVRHNFNKEGTEDGNKKEKNDAVGQRSLPATTYFQKKKSTNAAADLHLVEQDLNNVPKLFLLELPSFPMGFELDTKMKIDRGGAVKFEVGNKLYDVSPAASCPSVQSLMMVNLTSESWDCVHVGEIDETAVVTADVNSTIDNA